MSQFVSSSSLPCMDAHHLPPDPAGALAPLQPPQPGSFIPELNAFGLACWIQQKPGSCCGLHLPLFPPSSWLWMSSNSSVHRAPTVYEEQATGAWEAGQCRRAQPSDLDLQGWADTWGGAPQPVGGA